SVLRDLLVDAQTYSVPMVTEEPSVFAASYFGAKIIAKSVGFTTTIHNRIMIGQVAIYDISDHRRAKQAILDHKES
ncbi:3-hydroxy-3-methylglutaryl-CoA reductase, partial [Streptococcus suis]